MWLKLAIFVAFIQLVYGYRNYSGFHVLEIVPKNLEQINLLHKLENQDNQQLDFWSLTKIPNTTVVVLVSPQYYYKFSKTLNNYQIKFETKYDDANDYVRNIKRSANKSRFFTRNIFAKYFTYDEINEYMIDLWRKFPDRVKISQLSKSYEGRDINVISITDGDDRNRMKKVIFVDAGIHAREWIAPAGALYVIDQLVNNFQENKHLLKDYYWIILPLVNPDGYEYSLNVDPFWRKTRQLHSKYFGVDGNRNFDFHWAETGTEFEPQSDIFHGPIAFSEPETRTVRDILHSLNGRCMLYLTLHSFGKYFLYPWGWTDKLPENWKVLDDVAKAGAAAIYKETGSKYTVGSSTNVLYPAAGGSDDYALGVANVTVAITVEMNGKNFHPKPELIEEYVKENWYGIKAMAEKVIQKYN